MMAVTTTLCPLATTYGGLILYAVSFGMFDGCFVLLIAVVTSDIVGPSKLAQALGALYGVIAVPMIFGPPLAGIFQRLQCQGVSGVAREVGPGHTQGATHSGLKLRLTHSQNASGFCD